LAATSLPVPVSPVIKNGVALTSGHQLDHFQGLADGLASADHADRGCRLVEKICVAGRLDGQPPPVFRVPVGDVPKAQVLCFSPQAMRHAGVFVFAVGERRILGDGGHADGWPAWIVIGLLQKLADAVGWERLVEDRHIRCHCIDNIERLGQVVGGEHLVCDLPCGVTDL
jgi:hypothetical protein